MALTSRDVMFVMRSQDFASRGVMGLAGSFNKLQRELTRIDDTLTRKLNTSQATQNQMLEMSRGHLRRIVEPMKAQNDRLNTQNARLQENITALRTTNDVRNTHIRGLEREVAAQQKLFQSNLKQIEALNKQRASATAVRRGTTAAIREEELALKRQNGEIQNNVRALQSQIDKGQQATIARQAAIDQRVRTIALNRIERATNTEQMNEAVRNAQEVERAIKNRGEAQRAAARQEANIHRVRIQQFQQQIQKMQALGVAAMMMGAVLLAVGARGVRAFANVTREAAEFQLEMARVLTQIDPAVHGLGGSIDNLRGIAHGVAREVPAAMDTIGSSLFFIFSSMNVNMKESEILLRGFAREAVAGNSSIEDAARSTIAIMNGMRMGVEELTRVQDFQFQTVRKGVITYDELAHNIGKLIPSLQRAGQEIETGGAMLAFLTRNGLSAEMATTAAARSLELMADPRVVGRLERLGVTVRDSTTGAFLPLVDVLGQMADVLGDMPAPERAERMLEVFGGAGYRIQARRFFDTVLPNFEQFRQHIEWQINNAGSMERAYAIMFDEPINQIELLGNKWQVLRNIIGEQFFPVLAVVIRGLESVINWFENLTETQRSNLAQWLAIISVVAAVGGGLLVLIGILTTVTAMLAYVTASWGVSIGIMAGVPAVITLIAAALVYMLMNFDSVSDALAHFRESLGLTEGQLSLLIHAITYATLAFITFKHAAAIGAALTAIQASVVSATGAFRSLGGIMTLISKHPILLAIGAITTAVALLGKEARDARRLQLQFADSFTEVIDQIQDGTVALNDYADAMNEVSRRSMMEEVKNAGLADLFNDIGLTYEEFVDAIIRGGPAQDELLERFHRLRNEAQGIDITQWFTGSVFPEGFWGGTSDRQQLGQAIKLLERLSGANIEGRKTAIDHAMAMGGISSEIARYITMTESTDNSVRRHIPRQRELVSALIENKEAWEALDPELRRSLIATGDFDDALTDFNVTMQETSQIVDSLSTTFERLTNVQAGWDAALEIANERSEEGVESLLGLADGMKLWIEGLEQGEATTRGVFEDMANIMATHGEAMAGDSHLVMSAILDMGDAGPEAMKMLAEADPDEFLEVLRHIRLQAALTSDEVLAHMETMMVGMEAIMEANKDFPPAVMSEIMMDLVLIISKNKDLTDDQVQLLMDSMNTIISHNGNITSDEMNNILLSMVGVINSGTNLTDSEMHTLMQSMSTVVNTFGHLSSDEMTIVMQKLVDIMEARGIEGVNDFLAALRDGEERLGPIMDGWQARLNLRLGLNTSTFDSVLNSASARLHRIKQEGGFNKGGLVPGRGPDRDTVLAALTRGEFIMRRRAVDDIGVGTLQALNDHGRAAMFNRGGSVARPRNGSLNRTSSARVGHDGSALDRKLDKLIDLLAEREPIQLNVSTKDDPQDFAKRSATFIKSRM